MQKYTPADIDKWCTTYTCLNHGKLSMWTRILNFLFEYADILSCHIFNIECYMDYTSNEWLTKMRTS